MTNTDKTTPRPTADTDMARALQTLRQGGVILYPTDTVWGIGCDACCPQAVRRVYEIKRRADSKALIMLASNIEMIERYVDELPSMAPDLTEVATTPLTIIYDGARGLAPEAIAADGSVAMRIPLLPEGDFCMRLTRALRRPLVSTSANISGHPTPRTFAQIDPEIVAAVDYVCTTGRDVTDDRKPSGIIRLTPSNQVTIIR